MALIRCGKCGKVLAEQTTTGYEVRVKSQKNLQIRFQTGEVTCPECRTKKLMEVKSS
jgi:phage FluMu protein Com